MPLLTQLVAGRVRMRLDERVFILLPYPIRSSAACSRGWGVVRSSAKNIHLCLVLMGGEARGALSPESALALEPRPLPHGPLEVTASGWDMSHD